jgi:hypothetical protein
VTRKPTLAQRTAGFSALFALAVVHGRLAWILPLTLWDDRPPDSALDFGLFVYGMAVLYVLAMVVGAVVGAAAPFLILMALRRVVRAAEGEEEP